ncbi:hypothetical protein EIG74_20675 [Escherichia coli O10]|nr:hypothetical protein [Escherichia coli O10]
MQTQYCISNGKTFLIQWNKDKDGQHPTSGACRLQAYYQNRYGTTDFIFQVNSGYRESVHIPSETEGCIECVLQ